MPYSDSFKVTFIHIPKTGGSSIEKALSIVTSDKWGTIDHHAVKNKSLLDHTQHLTFKQIHNCQYPLLLKSDAILVALRDPIDRIYSHYIARNGQWLKPHITYRPLDFLIYVFILVPLIRLSVLLFGKGTRLLYSQYEHLIPQTDYLRGLFEFAKSNSTKLIFISLFDQDTPDVSQFLAIQLNKSISIPHLRKSKSKDKISHLRSSYSDKFLKFLYRDDYRLMSFVSPFVNTRPFQSD